MMPRPKGPKTEAEKIRLPKAWLEALDEVVSESDGEFASRAQLIRAQIYKLIKPKLDRKKR